MPYPTARHPLLVGDISESNPDTQSLCHIFPGGSAMTGMGLRKIKKKNSLQFRLARPGGEPDLIGDLISLDFHADLPFADGKDGQRVTKSGTLTSGISLAKRRAERSLLCKLDRGSVITQGNKDSSIERISTWETGADQI